MTSCGPKLLKHVREEELNHKEIELSIEKAANQDGAIKKRNQILLSETTTSAYRAELKMMIVNWK